MTRSWIAPLTKDPPTWSGPRRRRAVEKPVREIAKRTVPATTPEVAETRRGQRMGHQRTRLHAAASPRTRQQMKHAKVKDQNDSDHSGSSHHVRVLQWNQSRNAEEENQAGDEPHNRCDPFSD